LWVSMLALGL